MRRFTPPAASRAIDISQAGTAVKPAELRLNDVKLSALRGVIAVPVQGEQIVGARLDRGRQPDPQRTIGRGRGNRGDRIGQLASAGRIDQYDPGPDHEISICRRNNLVLKFNEIDYGSHADRNMCSGESSQLKIVNINFHYHFCPARAGLRSPVTAFSAARLISEA